MSTPEEFLALAVRLAVENVQKRKGRPFGAVLVQDGQVVATGVNTVLTSHDPSAHAEMEAIRSACRTRQSTRLDGHVMYASGQPCPMCLAAMYLAGIRQAQYAYSNEEAEPYGLSTLGLYAELAKPLPEQSMRLDHRPLRPSGEDLYELWQRTSRDQASSP